MRITAVLLVLLCLTAPAAAEDWSQYQADERNSGGYSGQSPVEPDRFVPVEGGVRSSVVPTDDAVYAIDGDGALHRLEPGTGEALWRFDRRRSESKSPIVAGGRVYLVTTGGATFALHRNGSVAWHTSLAGRGDSTPAVAGERLYVGHGRNVTALDRDSGDRRWTTSLDRPVATPVTVADRVYVAVLDDGLRGRLVALDPATGEILWRYSRPEVVTVPAVEGETVYVADQGGTVHALRAADAEVLWRRHLGNTTVSFPSVDDRSLYIGTANGTLHALSRTDGSTRWRFDGEGRLFGTPAVVDGTVYAMNRAGWLAAVDAATGRELWNGSLARQTRGSPTVVGDTVYVPTDSGIAVIDELRGRASGPVTGDHGGNDSSGRRPRPAPFPGPAHLVVLSLALVVLLVVAHLVLSPDR